MVHMQLSTFISMPSQRKGMATVASQLKGRTHLDVTMTEFWTVRYDTCCLIDISPWPWCFAGHATHMHPDPLKNMEQQEAPLLIYLCLANKQLPSALLSMTPPHEKAICRLETQQTQLATSPIQHLAHMQNQHAWAASNLLQSSRPPNRLKLLAGVNLRSARAQPAEIHAVTSFPRVCHCLSLRRFPLAQSELVPRETALLASQQNTWRVADTWTCLCRYVKLGVLTELEAFEGLRLVHVISAMQPNNAQMQSCLQFSNAANCRLWKAFDNDDVIDAEIVLMLASGGCCETEGGRHDLEENLSEPSDLQMALS